MKNKKNPVDKIELQYELIISKGKGHLTKRGEELIVILANELIHKFKYFNVDDRCDCLNEGLCAMLTKWSSFNEIKYDNAFSYMTEICKRGMAKGMNDLKGKYYSYTYVPKFVSITNIYTIKNND